jgi:hypothetical protein
MIIVPVNFNSEHKAMLGHCKMILETDGGRIAINPERFDKLKFYCYNDSGSSELG